MGDPTGFLQQYGWALGLLLWFITITILETRRHLPGVVRWIRGSRDRRQQFDEQTELRSQDAARDSRKFMEEQVFRSSSGDQTQNAALVEFVIREATNKLDKIVEHNTKMAQNFTDTETRILKELDKRLEGYQHRLDSIEGRLILIEGVIIRARYDREQNSGTD